MPTALTPYGEKVGSDQIRLIKAALQIAGFSVRTLHYHPATIASALSGEVADVVINLAYGFSSRAAGLHEEQPDVAARLEGLGCNLTGSTAAAQRLAQDKLLAAQVLAELGVKSPAFLDPDDWPDDVPCAVVKPRYGACHRDVKVVTRQERDRLPAGIGDTWLLQRYVDGPEYTVAVLDDPDRDELTVFPPLRIDFRASGESPAIMSNVQFNWIATVDKQRLPAFADIARTIFRGLDLRDYARLDFRLGSDGPVLLDANALPGINPAQGLFAMAAAAGGVDYHSVIWALARRAMQRKPA